MYSQSIFFSRNKKNNVYPYKPQFYYIKVGFKGSKLYKACFRNVYKKSDEKSSRNCILYWFQCNSEH